jgi:hypothetical protein
MLTYTGVKQNGEPYILPVAGDLHKPLDERKTYAILAFTVKTAVYGDTVIEKYMDLEDTPMYDGESDISKGGYHKFISQVIESTDAVSTIIDNPGKVYKLKSGQDFTYSTLITLEDGTTKVVRYSFDVSIPIEYEDTADLEPKEYVYDLILYFGELSNAELTSLQNDRYIFVKGFPLKTVTAKVPLITVHKFIVGDSNNV